MRREWLILVGLSLVCAWAFLDEEPLLDLTDLGFAQAVCLGLTAIAVAMENIGRAQVGIFVVKDRHLGFWAMTFWTGMDNYFRIIILGFFAHSLAPLWADQAESTSAYAFVLGSFWVWGAQVGAALTCVLSLLFCTPRVPAWPPLLLLVFVGWAASIGDWLVSGLGSNFEPSIGATREPLYGGGAGSTAYDPTLYAEGFDWHKAALEPVNFFFVDLASFLYGFLLVFALLVLVYTVILGALSTYGGAKLGPSFAFRAALIRGVEHTLVGAFAGALTWVGVGLRIGADFYAGAY